MNKARIELTDSIKDICVKMSEGNPGALSAIVEIIKNGERIDPDSFAGGLGTVLMLDTFGIYGTDIYILWSDICERDTAKMIAVLRACQLGHFSDRILKDAANRQDRTGRTLIPVQELYEKVKGELENFDRA